MRDELSLRLMMSDEPQQVDGSEQLKNESRG